MKVSEASPVERQLILDVLYSTLRMLSNAVGLHTEIVLHDLTNPERSILAIANGHVTGRREGGSLLGGPREDVGFIAVRRAMEDRAGTDPVLVENYPTVAPDGRPLRSSTVVYRDSSGQPFASLCINADLSGIAAAHALLGGLLGLEGAPESRGDEPRDMEQMMVEIIQFACPGGAVRIKNFKNLKLCGRCKIVGYSLSKAGLKKPLPRSALPDTPSTTTWSRSGLQKMLGGRNDQNATRYFPGGCFFF